jgi:benzodiazapine receptor
MRYPYKLIISVVACQVAGLIGSVFTAPSIETWYAALEKPAFTPPDWLFAPAWITLYLLMGVSASLVWKRGLDSRRNRIALLVFVVQLVLNVLWSFFFFGLESPLAGVAAIVLLWAAILITILKFFPISRLAGVLLVPYLAWVSFAAALNISIFVLNP